MIQGSQARSTRARAGFAGADASAASPSSRQTDAGFQTLRNAASAAIDATAATTSTSHGPWKLETRNCGTAKASPATRIAGQTASIPRNPANAQTSQNGTMTEKSGS